MLFFAHAYKVNISDKVLLGRIAIVITAGILVTHILRLVIKWRGWMMESIEKAIPKLIIALVFASMLFSLIVLGGFDYFKLGTDSGKKLTFFARLLGSTFDNGLFILPWLLIYYFYHFFQKSRRQQLDTLRLETLIKELELKTIKAHINPHFIFNALNSIRALVDENPKRARRAVTELSNILRSSMQSEKMETVPFEKELSIVKDYLALENMRFEDRLKIEYQIDEDTLNQPVPPMMLQTLVENAIKHGISKQIDGGLIKVISEFKGNFHELIVQNTGRLSGEVNEFGFGLSSTNNRLSLLYGEKANFEIKQVNGSMVEAKVLIPITVS
ncbi:MAG: histidine kinase [Chitinophagaceae bacterium]|nr:histidine kinase [Chitinophagaceae bacterium]MBK8310104.1 histidine kinase [Chitinophagaceae bacterium]MBK8607080.1 histidine kinase [Chitinophagaceae bacterium]MBP6477393.1 histidine kinase [Chitinophagaceae bacterium]MBP7107472.1 histidine kinase [Chitinophagaceae bacterium]